MSDLKELIKNIKIQQRAQNENFVIYIKETGKIEKIANRRPIDIPEHLEVAVVPVSTVQPILDGVKSVSEYSVVYDFSVKQIVVKQNNYEDHYSSANNFVHQFTKTNTNRDTHASFDAVYEGANVNIFIKQDSYYKDDLVWYNGAVYKFLVDKEQGEEFKFTDVDVFVENVKISDAPTIDHDIDLEVESAIYEGVHVDVWYDELEHKQGQHVWYKNAVYVMKTDQEKNTKFKKENCKLLEDNVILYDDENTALKFAEPKLIGDKYLKFNKLFMKNVHKILHEKSLGNVFFYSGKRFLIEASNDEIAVIDVLNSDLYSYEKMSVYPVGELKNGDIVLNGTRLFCYHVDKQFDLIIRKNNVERKWEVHLNPHTKKFLTTAGFTSEDTIFVSVTEKYDPNILYKTINIPVESLVQKGSLYIDFEDRNEKDLDCSIYTTKYFENYGYEEIN